jgi:hypothetical protein
VAELGERLTKNSGDAIDGTSTQTITVTLRQ